MADTSAGTEIGAEKTLSVVAYGVTDRRTAERLARAGLSAAVVEPAALAAPRVGALYLMPADRAEAEVVRGAVALGAHVCLLPPWPLGPDALQIGAITLAPARDRSGVRLASDLMRGPAGAPPSSRTPRILYREQLIGALGRPLAQTAAGGEVLLAALPRSSNRHGQVVATTLLVGTPSAQTVLEDVAVVLRALLDWLGRMPVDQAPGGASERTAPAEGEDSGDERRAQIALLALALALPAAVESDDETLAAGADDLAAARAAFDALARRLGQSPPDEAFERGWSVLRGRGIVAEGGGAVHPTALREYLGRWQLAARLRRLRPPRQDGG